MSDSNPNNSENLKEWPVTEGRYKVGNPESPVAVCTMASVDMEFPMDKISITGKCVTENLGVEKIIRNTISNPNIRYIIFCGKESRGHFVGQAVKSLKDNGVDEEKRIIGAKGGMPILKNLKPEEIERFREQVEPIDLSGEEDVAKILAKVNELFENSPGKFQGEVMNMEEEVRERRAEDHPMEEWEKDPQGFFTIRPDPDNGEIITEHHSNDGKIRVRITGKSAEDVYHHIIKNNMISRQDHAAYLGRELAKAEFAMLNNIYYEQDAHIKISKANNEQPAESRPGPEKPAIAQEPEKPAIPGPVPMRPVEKESEEPKKPEEPEESKLSMEERVNRLAQSLSSKKEPEKEETKGRFLTYYKGFKEIQLADSTRPDHEFRALLRERGLSRIF